MITLVSRFFSQPLISFGAIILLLSVVMITAMETTVYAQLLPKTVNIGNATNKLPTSAQVKSNIHLVKITSPIKGQQIPVRNSITVTGTSISKSPDCEVSVIVMVSSHIKKLSQLELVWRITTLLGLIA